MTHDTTPHTTDAFEELYQGETALGGFVLDTVPWDVGEPQPAVVALESTGLIAGDVLDAGCGPGDNALYLAARGHRVTGCDSAPSAVRRGREAAHRRDLAVEFTVADATRLDGWLPHRFDTVLDSALFHCLPPHRREAYAAALHRVCRAGARLHLLCVSEHAPAGIPVPYRITRDDIHGAFGGWWDIRDARPDTFTTAFTRADLRRVLERQSHALVEVPGIAYDGDGRALLPIWRVEAERLPGPRP
jgi:SAM-dependent methyltransferase